MGPSLTRRGLLSGLSATGLVGCAGGGGGGQNGGASPGNGLGGTPAADGFWAPAESDPHAGCLMQFPAPTNYCTGGKTDCNFIEKARAEWVAVANAISEHEPVRMYVAAGDMAYAQAHMSGAITLVEAELDDGWSRDTGPIIVRNEAGLLRAACFEFNGWGFSTTYERDAAIKWQMTADLGLDTYDHPMVLEGGAVILDGAGTLITTEQCLLHDTRNPTMSRSEQEQVLQDYLGVHTIIWVEKGWNPDPLTNGHIDGLVAFVEPGLVFVNSMQDSSDQNFQTLKDAKAVIEAAGIQVIDLPATSFTAFHINFYVANGAVIVPIEGRASVDDTPLGLIADAHPGMEIVGVETNTLGQAGGGIHCITQQVPEGVDWPG